MASQLTVPGHIVKWILLPAMLAGFGYWVVGPRIGKHSPPSPASSLSESGAIAPPTVQTSPPAGAPPAPSPVVGTSDATTTPPAPIRRKHRRHKKSKKVDSGNSVSVSSENYPQAPPGDQGETGSESETSH